MSRRARERVQLESMDEPRTRVVRVTVNAKSSEAMRALISEAYEATSFHPPRATRSNYCCESSPLEAGMAASASSQPDS